jgi:hypothetical protein
MNMLTPAIDKAFSGNQIKNLGIFKKRAAIICAISIVVALGVGALLTHKEAASTSSATSAIVETTDYDVSVM